MAASGVSGGAAGAGDGAAAGGVAGSAGSAPAEGAFAEFGTVGLDSPNVALSWYNRPDTVESASS